jgi:hypothetical protein
MTVTTMTTLFILCVCLAAVGQDGPANQDRWKEISAVRNSKTHLVPSTWNLDKYPDTPLLTAKARVTILEQDGPGVITQIHVSDYMGNNNQLILRVCYDGEEKPSIEMPLMEFMGDVESATPPYQTIYFSRVHGSHNFRLPMPFRKHIKVEIENTGETFCFGYTEVQWDEVPAIPAECGYLKVIYKAGQLKFPHEELTLCDIPTAGSIVAHWLQLTGDDPSCANGQGTCEANHEVYLDGDEKPTVECLGAEDFYGHSWGFKGLGSDSHSAIVRYDMTPNGGTRVAMVRARDIDRISFRRSCRIVLTYRHDLGEPYNPATRKGKAPALKPFVDGATLDVPYRSGIYYYAGT